MRIRGPADDVYAIYLAAKKICQKHKGKKVYFIRTGKRVPNRESRKIYQHLVWATLSIPKFKSNVTATRIEHHGKVGSAEVHWKEVMKDVKTPFGKSRITSIDATVKFKGKKKKVQIVGTPDYEYLVIVVPKKDAERKKNKELRELHDFLYDFYHYIHDKVYGR